MNRLEIIQWCQLAVVIFGAAAPSIWTAIRLRSILKDFPPHRHVHGRILFPKGYEPGREAREV